MFEKYWDYARCMKNFYRREKSIAFYDVIMSYGFQTKFQHSVTTTFFFALFSIRHFLCDRFVKI